MKIDVKVLFICGILFYLILPFVVWKFVKNRSVRNCLATIYFIGFLAVLVGGVFSKPIITRESVTIRFQYNDSWFSSKFSLKPSTQQDTILNLLILIPIGVMVCYFNCKKSFWKQLKLLFVVGLMFGLGIEGLQFILPINRYVQLFDVICNCLSVVIGGLMTMFWVKVLRLW